MLRYDQIDDHLEPVMTWPVADAKARFSELLDAALNEGPQVVSRRGIEAAVLVPIAEWKRLQKSKRRPVIDPFTDSNGPHDLHIPPRRKFTLHPANLED
jgi:antitoxin Phd